MKSLTDTDDGTIGLVLTAPTVACLQGVSPLVRSVLKLVDPDGKSSHPHGSASVVQFRNSSCAGGMSEGGGFRSCRPPGH